MSIRNYSRVTRSASYTHSAHNVGCGDVAVHPFACGASLNGGNIRCVARREGMFRHDAFTDESKPERCCVCVMRALPNDEKSTVISPPSIGPKSFTLSDHLFRRRATTQWNFPPDRRVNALYVTPGATLQRLRWASARRRDLHGVLVSSSSVTLFSRWVFPRLEIGASQRATSPLCAPL